MADNLTTQSSTLASIPASTKISTDEDATNGHVQRMKLAYSADGVSTHVQADADGVLVNLGANNDVTATLSATDNAVLDTINTAVVATQAAVEGTLTVDLGANNDVTVTSGTITANLGATDNAVLDTISSNTAAAAVVGGGTEATAQRVTIANDSTGVVTVDGTVTANLSATDNAVLDTINTAVVATQAAVEGTLTVGSHAVTNAGTFATQATLQSNTGVDIGDVDVTSVVPGTGATNLGKAIDTAAGATDTGVAALAVRDDALTTLTPIDGDYVPLRVNSTGALHVTGAGGGTQYNVDDAAPTVVTMAGAVRDDALTTLTEVDGDATVLRVSSTGALHVTGGGGGTEYTDDTSTHATGSTVGAAIMAVAVPTDSAVDANDMGVPAMSLDRRLLVDAQIVGTDAALDVSGATVTVDGSGVTQPVSIAGTVTVDLGANNDVTNTVLSVVGGGTEAAAQRVTLANDSTGVLSVDDNGGALTVDWAGTAPPIGAGTEAGALRVTVATDSTGVLTVDGSGTFTVDGSGVTQPVSGTVTANLGATDNAVLDQLELNTSYGDNVGNGTAAGSLRVTVASDTTGVLSIDDNGGSLTVDGTVTASNAAGDIAHDAADSGNPVKVGGKAVNFDGTAPGTAVAEADRANFVTDVYGRQFVETAHPNYWHALGDYGSAQTNATLKAAPGAGLKLYITDVIISNGATAGEIALLDGSAGSKVFSIIPAINGGAAHSFRTPIALTANTLLAVTSTTVTTHDITVTGYIAP